MKLSRRRFMQTVAVGAAVSGWQLPIFGQSSQLNTLKIPELYYGDMRSGVNHYALTAQTGTVDFLPGLRTPTIGINGDYLGPTLRLMNGDDVAIAVRNQLGEETTLHWHGLHVPAKVDGGPAQIIAAGAEWNPQFRVSQKAGSFWYHSHMLHQTGAQVYRGLSGMIIIDDEDSSKLELPAEYGVDDIPLIVQDRRFNADGSFRYIGMHMDVMTGMYGDTILVNGTGAALFTPTTQRVRFRLLTAANARSFNFAFDDNREFQLIASDSGLLSAPVTLHHLELAPAERAEIVVNFSDGAPVKLVSLPLDANSPFTPQGMMRNMLPMNSTPIQILAIAPQSQLESRVEIPDQLAEIQRISASEAQHVRRFTLSMPMGMGMMNMRASGGRGQMGNMGNEFQINGKTMDMATINERVNMGDTEIWEITNDSMMMHPFHIHQGQFQILDRNGVPPPAAEMGFKDTLRVGPGETARIIMRFEHFADPETAYMYHCHILEHEDNGMMGQFTVS